MSKKYYELIANVITDARKRNCDENTLYVIASQLGDALTRDNVRFDYVRFMKACGFLGG